MDKIINQNKEPKALSQERVALPKEVIERIDLQLAQLKTQVKGLSVTRSDYLEHLVMGQPEQMPAIEVKQLKEKYFDPLAFTYSVYQELKDAKAKGLKLSLPDCLNPLAEPPRRRRRRVVVKNATNITASANTEESGTLD
jgi:hypothetical protein